jgi:hypothetical protein
MILGDKLLILEVVLSQKCMCSLMVPRNKKSYIWFELPEFFAQGGLSTLLFRHLMVHQGVC